MWKSIKNSFKSETRKIRDALSLCAAHERDGRILLTENPDGLYAIRDPDVKAVILAREVPAPIAAFFNAESIARRAFMKVPAFAARTDGTLVLDPSIRHVPSALVEDIEARFTDFALLFGDVTGAQMRKYPENKAYVAQPHIDGTPTLVIAYAGAGTRLFPGDVTRERYEALAEQPEAAWNLQGENVPEGHIALLKGCPVGFAPYGQPLGGPLHCAPPFPSEDRKQNRRAALLVH